MKIIKTAFLLLFTLSMQATVSVETWNEPWQKEIIQNADYFVLAKVLSHVDSIGTEIQIIKHFGDQKLEGSILITGFSMLQLASYSGHGYGHVDFEKDQSLYFFLTKMEDGSYGIPTPTSGFAFLDAENNVYATYRHSYHQALVPKDIYEKTYTEIWSYYKTSKYNKKEVLAFIDEYIDKEPAGFVENELATFFLQHVALETAYLLDLQISLERLQKFVEFDNFHSKVSALRLLGNSNEETTMEFLFDYISNEQNENFEKVIAIWSLSKIGGEKYKDKMRAIVNTLSEEETGFGGNIMDPRVATFFPSPKGAVNMLK